MYAKDEAAQKSKVVSEETPTKATSKAFRSGARKAVQRPVLLCLGLLCLCLVDTAWSIERCPKTRTVRTSSNNPKFSGSCQVYKRGESPCMADTTELGEATGWITVAIIGPIFCGIAVLLTMGQFRALGLRQSSEMFNTAGRSLGPGLTASTIVSKWTWAASLLMSSNMGWTVGLSGPFWYASGASIQILLFSILAVSIKRRASHMHTYLEVIKVRFGTVVHVIMIVFALSTNVIVTSMLLLGGAAAFEDLTGMSKIMAALFIPITSAWIYSAHGGLRGTILASYLHTVMIFLTLIIFTFGIYAVKGEGNYWGSPANVHQAVEKATVHAFYNATFTDTQLNVDDFEPRHQDYFSGLGAIMQNDGECFDANRQKVGKKCGYVEKGKDSPCCVVFNPGKLKDGNYCRKEGTDCMSLSKAKHFESTECNSADGEHCVTSFLSMGSTIGLVFGITNIVGNFGTVFVDQSYWQSAIAAKSGTAGPIGFLIGGMVWFAVPFCMATTLGIAGRALTTHPDIQGSFGAHYITAGVSGIGLTPGKVVAFVLGPFGAFLVLLQLFAAISSTGAAEILAVSSILTYDVYYEYIHPALKVKRSKKREVFDRAAGAFLKVSTREALSMKTFKTDQIQGMLDELAAAHFFDEDPSSEELQRMGVHFFEAANEAKEVSMQEVYDACALDTAEGQLLLSVSRMFAAFFAFFMGFLATFLLTFGIPLGHVYMSMGCIVGSAVGPAAISLMIESANGIAVGAGAVGGFFISMIVWVGAAANEFGEIRYETMMSDWPWVAGNLGAILGGTIIALVGTFVSPSTHFKWEHLNAAIPLVDDVVPAPEDELYRSPEFMSLMNNAAAAISVGGSFLLIVLWPGPMHLASGVFSETGFSIWIALEFIWLLVAGGVIIILPAWEMRNILFDYQEKTDKLLLKPGSASRVVADERGKGHKSGSNASEKNKLEELQAKIDELEEAGKKARDAQKKSDEEKQKIIDGLKEENKKAAAAPKKLPGKPPSAASQQSNKPKAAPKAKGNAQI